LILRIQFAAEATMFRHLLVRLFLMVCAVVAASDVLLADETIITTIGGTGKTADAGSDSSLGSETNVGQPFGVEIGPEGALYVTEVQNHRVRRLDLKSGTITSVAGNGKQGYAGDGGPASEASLNEPYEVRFDAAGNMFFVEMQNHLIRRVDRKTGVISTVAGTGKAGYGGDGGPATEALFSSPHSIAFDGTGLLYVADIGNHRIRRIDLKANKIESIAGNGEKKLAVEGQRAAGNPLLGPRALAIDGDTLWIALREGHSVWRMSLKEGVLHRVAGTGKSGYSGDGQAALEATFNGPKGIAVGPDNCVYVVDTENQAIRRIDPKSGKISTVAGSGPQHRGAAGDGGPATKGELNRPHGICVGPNGTIYIGDSENHRVRKVAKE
jgi:streptogramin lyase